MRAELQRNITKTPPKSLCHPGAIGQKTTRVRLWPGATMKTRGKLPLTAYIKEPLCSHLHQTQHQDHLNPSHHNKLKLPNLPLATTIKMRTLTFTLLTLTLFHTTLAQKGFHILDRRASWIHKTAAEACPKRVNCADIREPFDEDGVWLVPANNFNCDVIRDKNYFEGIAHTWDIGHGTTLKGQCGAGSLTFFPVDGGQGLEVWEGSGAKRFYGKCYRQEAGRGLNCDSPGDGYGCSSPLAGQPVPNSCKIRATDVWVCPVDLCGL